MEDGVKSPIPHTKPCHLRDTSVSGEASIVALADLINVIKTFVVTKFCDLTVYKREFLWFQSATFCPGQGTAEDGTPASQPTNYPTDSLYGGELIQT